MCGVFGKVKGILYHVYFCFCLECDGKRCNDLEMEMHVWLWFILGIFLVRCSMGSAISTPIAQFCATHLFIFGSEFGSVKLVTSMQRSPGDA